jgi:galactokinase
MKEVPPYPSSDFAMHLAVLRGLPQHDDAMLRTFFEQKSPIYVARAPGRLDVMGGIGDYSGSLVLQLPIDEAAFAAAQLVPEGGITVASLHNGSPDNPRSITIAEAEWAELQRGGYDAARQILADDPNDAWAAYVLGPVLVLLREAGAQLSGGLRILIDSRIPEGKGVSSSAALEVATMRAIAALAGIELRGEELARLCQLAENLVVGAPCGIMDQMTAALGRENQLLALRCQPATVEGYVRMPDGIAFWGIDSGIRHAVSGSDYTSVRCGAFMGYRIIADADGLKAKPASDAPGRVEIDDPKWNGYVANVSLEEFRERFASVVPEQLSGSDFLARYRGTTDRVTRVDPARTYAVRRPTLHPIEENERAGRFRDLLEGDINDRLFRELGELMAAAHDSYSACGLGSDGTDLLVKLVCEAGPASGLYGAKITGGGSGGTVAVLGRTDADRAIDTIAARYTENTGLPTHIFCGSSPGACATEVVQVTIDGHQTEN